MWGINHLQFLSWSQQALFVGFSFVILNMPNRIANQFGSVFSVSSTGLAVYLIALIISVLYGLIIWNFPVAVDIYGDSYKFVEYYSMVVSEPTSGWNKVLGFSLDAWAGQKTYEGLVELVSYYLKIDALSAFRILGLFFGVCYAFVYVAFVLKQPATDFSKFIFVMVGLFSPYTLIFFGRAEVYAFPLLTTLIWSIFLIRSLTGSNTNGFVVAILVLVFFLNLKAHPVALLSLPITLFAVVNKFTNIVSRVKPLSLFLFTTLPVFLVGLLVYFFVLGDHLDSREMDTTVMQYDHLFLPLFSPEAPLDMYNLLSFNHIFDFVNLYLLMLPGGMLLFLVLLLKRVSFDVTKAALVTTIVLYTGLYFGINPLLSMPVDWDLFTVIVPIMLVFLVHLASQFNNAILKAVLSITVLMSSFFVLHNSKELIAPRFLSITQHVHKTYYAWTNIFTERAMLVHHRESKKYERVLNQHIDELSSHSIKTIDVELSQIQKNFGKWYLREATNAKQAELKFLEALMIDPNNWNAQLLLTEALYVQGRYVDAYNSARSLQRFKRADKKVKVLKMIIDCAEQAEMYAEASEAAAMLVAVAPTEQHKAIKANVQRKLLTSIN